MSQRSFDDLSNEQKGMVVGGLALVPIVFAGFFVVLFANPLHLTNHGYSGGIFLLAVRFMISLVVVSFIPGSAVYFVVCSFFVKYSKVYWIRSFLSLLVILAAFVLSYAALMFTLNILCVNASIELQIMLFIVADFSCGILWARVTLSKKIGRKLGLLKKTQ